MKDHFEKTFWFIVGVSAAIFAYIFAVTYLNIPEKNQRFVDIAFGSLLTLLSTNSNYLTGGNPAQTKKNNLEGTTTASISADITTDNKES